MSQLDKDYATRLELIRLLEQQERSQKNGRLLFLLAGLGFFWGVAVIALLGFLL